MQLYCHIALFRSTCSALGWFPGLQGLWVYAVESENKLILFEERTPNFEKASL